MGGVKIRGLGGVKIQGSLEVKSKMGGVKIQRSLGVISKNLGCFSKSIDFGGVITRGAAVMRGTLQEMASPPFRLAHFLRVNISRGCVSPLPRSFAVSSAISRL